MDGRGVKDEEIAPNATVYVRNLDENVKIPTLVESLREIFAEYGNIIDIVAKKSLKRKGQAFVVFDSAESAQNAIDEINGFELFDRQINCQFAKTKSDATVQREGTEEEFEQHKRQRLTEKERKQAAAAAERKKRPAPDDLESERPKQARVGVVPDEHLSPNTTLMVSGVPESYTVDMMTLIFGRFPDFKEYLEVPGRPGLGFVHYNDLGGAISAKNATSGMQLADSKLKVTYQRK
ncbi:hypothetical protein BDZ85DRAFT_256693 [Elsinoe ampelina]|uniref:RRM domain-containing protein n=1 Tax=Elsinoe ampelina TaxID=302913 RepID=A0A6A6GM39_9PEZI|nr:hypothetical protein BDZ85DRAFT_256693 [Elsinoe ampelina]